MSSPLNQEDEIPGKPFWMGVATVTMREDT
jgi:hypothetical protein